MEEDLGCNTYYHLQLEGGYFGLEKTQCTAVEKSKKTTIPDEGEALPTLLLNIFRKSTDSLLTRNLGKLVTFKAICRLVLGGYLRPLQLLGHSSNKYFLTQAWGWRRIILQKSDGDICIPCKSGVKMVKLNKCRGSI